MFSRILSVARVTFLECLRSKSLWIALVIIMIQALVAYMMKDLTPQSRIRSLQTLTVLSFNIFILLGILIVSGNMIPRDLEKRHLYFVFVKPLRNWEFLFGKILGVWGILLVQGIFVSLSLTVFISNILSTEESFVNARARVQKISVDVPGQLIGDELQLNFSRKNPQGVWRLPETIREATRLVWQQSSSADGKQFYCLLKYKDFEKKFVVQNKKGYMELELPVSFRRQGTELTLYGNRFEKSRVIAMATRSGSEPLFWQSHLVDRDFGEEDVEVILDLRQSFPGRWYDLEISSPTWSHRQLFETRRLYRLSMPLELATTQNIDLKFKLHDSRNQASFSLNSRRLWIEGSKHSIEGNIWRGLGISVLHLMAIATITLIASVFLTAPTSMLLGFTIFLCAHNVSSLQHFPEIMFSNVTHHSHGDHHHDVISEGGNERTLNREVVEKVVEGLIWVFPDFEKFSPSTYFNRSEFIPMAIFFKELVNMLGVLALCLTFGSLIVSRKEFLK